MNPRVFLLVALLFTRMLFGQQIDTLTFYSDAFQQERQIFVHTPEFYKYQSDEATLPVIYVLDGQHEWFVNPVLSNIRYLQYTHEVPQAIVVVIPLQDRNQECDFSGLEQAPSKLHRFLTEEVHQKINGYHPNEYRVIIGHSFSASFALYSYYKSPNYYSAVLAHTPLHQLEALITGFQKRSDPSLDKIYLSIGGIAKNKDYPHRNNYNQLKARYPSFFESIQVFESDQSAHTAVPIVANPYFLTKLFAPFSSRYSTIAQVDDEYKLINKPQSMSIEMDLIRRASKIGIYDYGPEIPDLNGLASRYLASDLNDYGRAIYELGLSYFPDYYEFHLALYELYFPINQERAKYHLERAEELIQLFETDTVLKKTLFEDIKNEKLKNAW